MTNAEFFKTVSESAARQNLPVKALMFKNAAFLCDNEAPTISSLARTAGATEPEPEPEPEPERIYVNYYECPYDGTEWQDRWSCQCNDKCPLCGKEIEPYESVDA